MLNQLYSDDAKAILISRLLRKGKEVPQEYVQQAIRVHVGADRFRDAAELAEKAGMKGKAQELYARAVKKYEEEGLYEDAAEVAERVGMLEKAGRRESAKLYRSIEKLLE
ncbi:MAG: hypothetical protein QXQ40_01605 [Candidatus Aenigmatarchaeota archaeon]